MRVQYAIVFVGDMARSLAFYRDVIGLPLAFESPQWSEFSTDGARLALHEGEPRSAGEAEAARSAAGSCRPGLSVPDLDAFHARMMASGVECVQQPTDLHGTRLAQYLDPDGLALSVSEERKRG